MALLSLIVLIRTSYLAKFELRDRERITLLAYFLVDFVLKLLQRCQLYWQVFHLLLLSFCLFCLFSGIVVIDVEN